MEGKLKEEVSKKISMVIASLTNKAQKALLVQGLYGVAISASPGKKGELFTDMHGYSSG